MTFPETENAQRRTDQSFRTQQNPDHHKNRTPFEDLPIDMIRCFPVDYMHQTCLGCMRRLILVWLRGKKETKLSVLQAGLVNNQLVELKPFVPDCFGRKPRGFDTIEMWKAIVDVPVKGKPVFYNIDHKKFHPGYLKANLYYP